MKIKEYIPFDLYNKAASFILFQGEMTKLTFESFKGCITTPFYFHRVIEQISCQNPATIRAGLSS